MTSRLSNLLERRVPQSVALYIGVSWGWVQSTDFIVDEFLLSPHWTRVMLSAALFLLPSVLLLAWFHGQPGPNRITTVEKVGIPSNLAVAALLLVQMWEIT